MRLPATIAALLLALAPLLSAQSVTTIAGTPGVVGSFDGPAAVATFNRPTWLDIDRKTNAIYVVDRLNGVLRKISAGRVETRRLTETVPNSAQLLPVDFGGALGGGIVIEAPSAGCGGSVYGYGMFVTNSANDAVMQLIDVFGTSLTFANRDANTGLSPNTLANPTGLALSWGYTGRSREDALYIAETGSNTIRRIRFVLSFEGCMQPFTFENFAGAPNEAGFADGDRLTVRFNAPRGSWPDRMAASMSPTAAITWCGRSTPPGA